MGESGHCGQNVSSMFRLEQTMATTPRFVKHNSPHPTLADHSRALAAPLTRVITLPNGLCVATESDLSAKTATVDSWIDVGGSRFETEGTNGIAYFTNHMIFKGTDKDKGNKNRARRKKMEIDVESGIIGAHFVAYTMRELVACYAKDVAVGGFVGRYAAFCRNLSLMTV